MNHHQMTNTQSPQLVLRWTPVRDARGRTVMESRWVSQLHDQRQDQRQDQRAVSTTRAA